MEFRQQRHNVFDPNDADYAWFHQLGNQLHIVTKERTVATELANFPQCDNSDEALYEIERHLRDLRYFRDAKVSRHSDEQVVVQTWDTWSLLPIFEFSRSAGENEMELGLRDSNLLGYGIDSEIIYFDDYQRSGYQLRLRSAIYGWDKHYGQLILADSEDGERYLAEVGRPFVSSQTAHANHFIFDDNLRIDSINQGNDQANRFEQHSRHYGGWYGWAPTLWRHQSQRWRIGLFGEEHRFRAVTDTVVTPQDRQMTVLWGGFAWQQERFERMQNIFLINATEDINLGWSSDIRLGWEVANNNQNQYLQLQLNKGTRLNQDWLWLTALEWLELPEAEQASKTLTVDNRLYWSFAEDWRAFWRWQAKWSDNLPIDKPLVLDEDVGLRGFPLQYQHGQYRNLLSSELRYYPNITVWQLAEIAAATFYDIGRAGGDSPYIDNPTGTLQSVGIGLRFYISYGGRNVLHLDFARPISNDPNVDDWQWSVVARRRF